MKTGIIHFIISVILFLFVLLSPELYGINNEYDVANIPKELLSDADIIIRKNSVHFEVLNEQDAVMKVKIAVTIFKKDKQDKGEIQLTYNKFVEISALEGIIYDEHGQEIRDLDNSDIKDYSNFSDYSLYEDNRVKYAELYYDKFPYTVEYYYEIKYDGYLNWPEWYSRESIDAVEQNSFTVTVPSDYELRYWCNSDTLKPVISRYENKKDYYWEANNLPKLSDEAEHDDMEDLAFIVRIAPSTFDLDGYTGSMLNWKDFGHWYYSLTRGKDILPTNARKDIQQIIDNTKGQKERIAKLYSYMQSRTHYVSIQLGIGGWQPFDADYVHTNGYGDCKALSNYMVSILEHARITAYPVLIKSGENKDPLIKEFPSNQFNHVMVVVPAEKDTIWLECTSQDLPAGCIGWNCENRKALMITPEGGRIINTPVSRSDQNLQERTASVSLNTSGTAEVVMNTIWTGDQYNYALAVSKKETFDDQAKWLKKTFKVADIKLNKFSFNGAGVNTNKIDLELSVTLSRYGTVSGKRIFFNPNMADRRTNIPDELTRKVSPVRYSYPYLDIDSVEFSLPAGYKVEAVPEEVNTETSFGRFISKTTKNSDNSISFYRLLEIKNYSIPAKEYEEYRNFFSKVVKADRAQVVLSRK